MDKRDCRVNYKCPKAWGDLNKTDNPDVRYCNQCEKNVHFCADVDALKEANIEYLCVAVPVSEGFEEGVMMGDIDWSGFGGEPPSPLPPEKTCNETGQLENLFRDEKLPQVDFPPTEFNASDSDPWLDENVDLKDPLSVYKKPK